MTIERILWPTDFSTCAQQALVHAIRWARRFDAEIHVLHVITADTEDPHDPAHYAEDGESLHEHLRHRAEEAIGNLLAAHGTDDLDVTVRVREGTVAASTIKRYVADRDVDLVVIGTHGRRGFRSLFIGSVAEEVMREAECSVLAIRETDPPQVPGELRRILLPLDFSPRAADAVRIAKALARLEGGTVRLLHVIEEAILPDFYYAASEALFLAEPELREEATRRLEALDRETDEGPPVEVEIEVIGGHAASDIGRRASEWEADLVLLPTHGHEGVDRLLLGSVADKVLRTMPVPALVLKPFGRTLLPSDASDAASRSSPAG